MAAMVTGPEPELRRGRPGAATCATCAAEPPRLHVPAGQLRLPLLLGALLVLAAVALGVSGGDGEQVRQASGRVCGGGGSTDCSCDSRNVYESRNILRVCHV